ncbi:glutathione S-transferase domain-containing protein [Hyaloraphidium curvatum]|nr:glutathione S-transferase domain-containing protein [Hyaloraphidium curvatum]
MGTADRIAVYASQLSSAGNAGNALLHLAPVAGGTGKPKLLDAQNAPNPRLVRRFIYEKGIADEVEVVNVDLMGMENRREPYLSKNPAGMLPALELPDGTVVAESTVICELLHDLFPDRGPDMLGATPAERAVTHMWLRRIDHRVGEPLTHAFKFGAAAKFFAPRMKIYPEGVPSYKAMATDGIAWFEEQMAKGGKPYLQGDRMMLSDLVLYNLLSAKNTVAPEHKALQAWLERMGERESVKKIAS